MRFFDRISGKAIEDKVGEFGEVFGEVLLGLHRDIEKQARLVQSGEERVNALSNTVKNLESLCTKIQADTESGFSSLHEAINQFRSEANALSSAKDNLSRLAQELSEISASTQNEHKLLTRRVGYLQLLCVISYLLIIGVGITVWTLR